MGIARPHDPYGMTAPPAWPEADEEVLRGCRDAFDTVRLTVKTQWENAEAERTQMFDGVGIWSGKAGDAAHNALRKRIADLESLENQLQASVDLFDLCIKAVVDAKNDIIDVVNKANDLIDQIQSSSKAEGKEAAIQAIVDAARAANIAIVDAAAGKISGKSPGIGDALGLPGNGLELFGPGLNQPSPPTALTAGAPLSGGSGAETQALSNALKGADGKGSNVGASGLIEDPPLAASGPQGPDGKGSNVGAPGLVENPPAPPGPPAAPGAPPAPSGVPGGTSALPGLGGPGAPSSPGRVGMPSSPLSSPSTAGSSTPSVPSTANPAAAAAGQTPASEFQRAMTEATKAATAQPMPPPQPSMGAPATAQPPTTPSVPDTPPAPPPAQTPAASGPSGVSGGGSAPVAPPPTTGSPAAPAMPLGPPPTPPPAAPIAPAGPVGPGVAPAAAGAAGSLGAPAPVPVSAARAEREAIAAAAAGSALRRQGGGNDPLQVARRVGAALNAGENIDFGFFWITALTADGTIIVANSYGIAYIPEGVNLPEQVKMASADESIPAGERAKWATYPILAVQSWAQHHNTKLRAVVATEDQFKNFDPGAAKITLQPDDIPANGQMEGRSRLAVIAPESATRLAAVSDAGLPELLPPAPADVNPPADESFPLWFEVIKPMMSTATDRGVPHLEAFVTYANHAQELAVYRAHTAADPAAQRAAIADWIYWQHVSVLVSDSLAGSVSK